MAATIKISVYMAYMALHKIIQGCKDDGLLVSVKDVCTTYVGDATTCVKMSDPIEIIMCKNVCVSY